MNKREQSKIETRSKILKQSLSLIEQKGFIKSSLRDISNNLNISQGTIILHFGSKKNLFLELLCSNIDELEKKFIDVDVKNISMRNFVDLLVDTLGFKELFLHNLYRDYYHMDQDMRDVVNSFETNIKNMLLDNYRSHSKKRVHIVNAFTAIDGFVNQIKSYLASDEVMVGSSSILNQKRGRIYKLYSLLFEVKV